MFWFILLEAGNSDPLKLFLPKYIYLDLEPDDIYHGIYHRR